MQKIKGLKHDPDLLEEYDFGQGIRGKYLAQIIREHANISKKTRTRRKAAATN